jgi:hypothetical protein
MAEAQFHYGRLSYLMGDREEAYAALSQVVSLKPRSSIARAAKEYLDKLRPPQPQHQYEYQPEYEYQYEYDPMELNNQVIWE